MNTYTSGKIKIKETHQGLIIYIPSEKNWFQFGFIAFWLVGWALGEYHGISVILKGEFNWGNLFVILWTFFWTLGGGFVTYQAIYMLFGSKTIEFRSDLLIIKSKIAFYLGGKAYDIKKVRNLHIVGQDENISLKFRYGTKKIKLIGEIDMEDAEFLLDFIQSKRLIQT